MKRMLLSLPPNRVRRNYRGGRQLDELEGQSRPADSDRPEDWIASTVQASNPGLAEIRGEGLARVVDADGRTHQLRDLFARHGEHYLGRAHVASLGAELGFLVKLLDSAMRLHVQAHPTAAFARRHLGSRWGKLETYVILAVRDGCDGAVRLGFQRSPGPAEWRRVVLEQDIAAMDACFDPVPVAPGEVWVVPGGMPHAIGEGLLVLETMEPTDLVVRCEFEREGIVVPPAGRFMGRDPDLALGLIEHESQSADQVRQRCRVPPTVLAEEEGLRVERLIGPRQTACFAIERVRASRPADLPAAGTVRVAIAWGGRGAVGAGAERVEVSRGSRLLIAAAADALHLDPEAGQELELLLCRPG